MKLLDDLRFIIGVLFAILGVVVLATGLFGPAAAPGTVNANIVGGTAMTAFAILMLALALTAKPRDQ